MKYKKKLSKMEKFALREYEVGTEAVNRFLHEETVSLPCGNSPGMFISELFQISGFKYDTDPFAAFKATEAAFEDAQRIARLSRIKDEGAGIIMLAERTCDVNGSRFAFPDTAFIQISTKSADICYSLLFNAADTFAADVLVDSFSNICFMMIEAADIGMLCVPLNEFRFLSIDRNRKCGENTGHIVEYEGFLKTGIHNHIIFGDTLDRVIKATGMDDCKNRCAYKPVRQ